MSLLISLRIFNNIWMTCSWIAWGSTQVFQVTGNQINNKNIPHAPRFRYIFLIFIIDKLNNNVLDFVRFLIGKSVPKFPKCFLKKVWIKSFQWIFFLQSRAPKELSREKAFISGFNILTVWQRPTSVAKNAYIIKPKHNIIFHTVFLGRIKEWMNESLILE